MATETGDTCHSCPKVEVVKRSSRQGWELSEHSQSSLRSRGFGDDPLTVIVAKADDIRECKWCQAHFTKTFRMPELWWAPWCRRSNGYFGSDRKGDDQGNMDGYQTWFRFLTKPTWTNKTTGKTEYTWYKFNVFSSWVMTTQQTTILVFDPHPDIKAHLLDVIFDRLPDSGIDDPYKIHLCFLEYLVHLQDEAVWAIRDLVRNTEKKREVRDAKAKKDDKEALTTQADYVNLHDVARHTIHVCETLDVAIDTVSSMIKAHDDLNSFFSGIATTKQVRMSLDFFDNILHSLRSRSASNKERLHDETQLSFNLIALHDSELAHFDSEVSIGIGRATQRDGRAMKTLAFLSLAFLPATFVSAIFSMSFYNFNPDTGKWILSSKVWIYWAVTIPVTVLTVLIWLRWSRSPLPDLVEKGQSPRRDCKTSDSSEEKSLDSRYEERKIEIV